MMERATTTASQGTLPNGVNSEVTTASEILDSLMSRSYAQINFPFMDEVDPDALDLKDYRKIVTMPMWLRKMSSNFNEGFYHSIREFVSDFRLMLLNCYRYYGTTSRMGRLAEKLELLFEQKLQLLSSEIRNKVSIQSTLGETSVEEELTESGLPRRRSSNRLFLSGDSRQLTPMRALIEELEHALQPGSGSVTASLIGQDQAGCVGGGGGTGGALSNSANGTNAVPQSIGADERAAMLIRRLSLWRHRRHEEALLSSWSNWWSEMKGAQALHVLQNSPEMLEVYQFLWLADPFLGITEALTITCRPADSMANRERFFPRGLSLYDLELGLAVAPRCNQLLAFCMTILLATPRERGLFVTALNNAFDSSAAAVGSNSQMGTSFPSEGLYGHGGGDFGDSSGFSGGRRRSTVANSQQSQQMSSLSPLAYDIWERRLATKVLSWYRAFWDKGKGSLLWAARRLGISPHFFHTCGLRVSPLENKRFHELPVYQRIQLVHVVCDTTLRNFENLRLSLDKSADWESARPVLLGSNPLEQIAYINFPGLADASTGPRVYRTRQTEFLTLVDIHREPVVAVVPKVTGDCGEAGPQPNGPTATSFNEEENEESLADSESESPLSDSSSAVSPTAKWPCRRRGRRGRGGARDGSGRSRRLFGRQSADNMFSSSEPNGALPVPGPVQRLPAWLPPLLARTTHNRFLRIASEQLAEAASQQPAVFAVRGGTRLPGRSSARGLRGRGRGRERAGLMVASTAGRVGVQQEEESAELTALLREEPALRASPYATLNGLKRRFLCMQSSRGGISAQRAAAEILATSKANDDTESADAGETNETEADAEEPASSPSAETNAEAACPSPQSSVTDSCSDFDQPMSGSDECGGEKEETGTIDKAVVSSPVPGAPLVDIPVALGQPVEASQSSDNSPVAYVVEAGQAENRPGPTVEGGHHLPDKVEGTEDRKMKESPNSEHVISEEEESKPDAASPCLHKVDETLPDSLQEKVEIMTDTMKADPEGHSRALLKTDCASEETKPDLNSTEQEEHSSSIAVEMSTDKVPTGHLGECQSEKEDGTGVTEIVTNEEEAMLQEPDLSSFALVASDTEQLSRLLTELQASLASGQSKLDQLLSVGASTGEKQEKATGSTATVTEAGENGGQQQPVGSPVARRARRSSRQFSLSTNGSRGKRPYRSAKADRLSAADEALQTQVLHQRQALSSLKKLVENLQELLETVKQEAPATVEARQLVYLRVRRDDERCRAEEDRKAAALAELASAKNKASEEKNNQQHSREDSTADLASERTARLQRRSQLTDDGEDESSDSGPSSPSSDVDSDSGHPRAARHRSKASRHRGLSPPGSPGTESGRPLSTAFIRRFDAYGTPKIPIFRTSSSTSNTNTRGGATVAARMPLTSHRPPPPMPMRCDSSSLSLISSRLSSLTAGYVASASRPPRPNLVPIAAKPYPTTRWMRPNRSTGVSSPPLSSALPGIANLPSTSKLSDRSSEVVEKETLSNSARSASAVRKIYRIQDTLFTDDATPVRIDAKGALHMLPPESVPPGHRQLARQMIARYKQDLLGGTLAPGTA